MDEHLAAWQITEFIWVWLFWNRENRPFSQ